MILLAEVAFLVQPAFAPPGHAWFEPRHTSRCDRTVTPRTTTLSLDGTNAFLKMLQGNYADDAVQSVRCYAFLVALEIVDANEFRLATPSSYSTSTICNPFLSAVASYGASGQL